MPSEDSLFFSNEINNTKQLIVHKAPAKKTFEITGILINNGGTLQNATLNFVDYEVEDPINVVDNIKQRFATLQSRGSGNFLAIYIDLQDRPIRTKRFTVGTDVDISTQTYTYVVYYHLRPFGIKEAILELFKRGKNP